MGLKTWLVLKLGEDKTMKLLAILGGFLIFLVGNAPMSELIDALDWQPAYSGYLVLAWSAFVIAFSSITILFFGKSEMFPPTGTGGAAIVVDEVIDEELNIAEETADVDGVIYGKVSPP